MARCIKYMIKKNVPLEERPGPGIFPCDIYEYVETETPGKTIVEPEAKLCQEAIDIIESSGFIWEKKWVGTGNCF